MAVELNLEFISNTQFIINFGEKHSKVLDFESPINDKDKAEIQWYLEKYATLYMADVDDARADLVVANLEQWGKKLFNAVFKGRDAVRLYEEFLKTEGHLLTISAKHPEILALPWELLFDPESTFLHDHEPTISIRHRLGSADKALQPLEVKSKPKLRVLFVISRPSDASFIDPRADAKAVLEAVDEEGRFELEFLRPPTLENLTKRLECRAKYRKFPPVDVIHFDGHGVFRAAQYESTPMAETKKDSGGMGYLLFENAEAKRHLVDATTLGNMLNRKKVALIILSACQSAAMDGDEPMGCVAARLTHAGIPAVLAMSHSVLVATTRQLFATFYESLAYGAGIGKALDNARRHLYSHPERGERLRGQERITLKLYDWFLPTLYQGNDDIPLLTDDSEASGVQALSPKSNLPQLQEAGFFGRTPELWFIERAFVQGTRRLTISGFGGQGKTYLAVEAGQWLVKTGLFETVCFVDYASFQGVDAVGTAVSTLGTVLGQSLVDADAATDALGATLVILDNLETVAAEPLSKLLTVAKVWSETGRSRVLLTTRSPDFQHPDYLVAGSLKHQALALGGLAEDDAVEYFQRLVKLPPAPSVDLPKRGALVDIFKQVLFHPLSIGLLGRELKVRRVAELGMALERFVAESPDDLLVASLNLSLDRVDEDVKRWLPRLGVFQGGAMEFNIPEITELSEEQWQTLRASLEATGLIQAELVPGVNVPNIRFHPTLAPALKSRLAAEELDLLLARHQECYYQLSGYLYAEDKKNPHQVRAIVLRELPNLMFAVKGALAAKTGNAVEFVEKVNWFLNLLGLNRDRADLTQQVEQIGGFLAMFNKGQHLYSQGQYQAVAQVFNEILTSLEEQPSYERCITLTQLGLCFGKQGQAEQANIHYQQGLAVAEQLEQSKDVKRHKGILHQLIADVLMLKRNFKEAKKAYEAALVIAKEQDDDRQIAVVEGQLGTLAMLQNNFQEAAERHHEALTIFQRLNEPEMEAVAHHQLGMVYQEAQQWDAAEQAYRESARIRESQGNLGGAAQTWNQLALVSGGAGKFKEAEAWYRKAIDEAKSVGDLVQVAMSLNNLADLIQTKYPDRLPEARQLAEESLAIMKTLDPSVSEIWTIYLILAEIAEQEGDGGKAEEYRGLMELNKPV
ncbi:tetratricopeptide repeat protein [Candidatus Halobeggiatoa sp. HSG11]|nr:tetratricopeptide repeat protein [Candidatus Halobeggiatoa sp. HSG11]